MGKRPTDSLGKSSELKLHCFCQFDAYSMPKDICSAWSRDNEGSSVPLFRKVALSRPVVNPNPNLSETFATDQKCLLSHLTTV